jgi:ribonuclease VapC
MVSYEATLAIARISQLAKGAPMDAILLAEAEAVFDDFILKLPATEIDITSEIGRHAITAAATYGKTVGHEAALNFGDCFSYAAARALGVGLLYKGNDFALTDLA